MAPTALLEKKIIAFLPPSPEAFNPFSTDGQSVATALTVEEAIQRMRRQKAGIERQHNCQILEAFVKGLKIEVTDQDDNTRFAQLYDIEKLMERRGLTLSRVLRGLVKFSGYRALVGQEISSFCYGVEF